MTYSIVEINRMNRDRFVEVLGPIFEHSPWVADRAWGLRPFHSAEHLYGAMMRQVAEASSDAILDLIRAHPDLATRLKVTGYSAGEQQGAGLDRLSPEEYERFSRLNRSYVEKFGFPFILAVTGKTKDEIVAAMQQRLGNDPPAERAQAIAEIARIAEIRLNQAIDISSIQGKDEPTC